MCGGSYHLVLPAPTAVPTSRLSDGTEHPSYCKRQLWRGSSVDSISAPRCFSTSPGSWGIYQDIASSSPVLWTQHCLELVHDHSHLPWWATIVVSTVALRFVVTFPLAAFQHYKFGKLELVKLEMDELVKELKRETAVAIKRYRWTAAEAKRHYNKSVKKQWDKLLQEHNCHPGQGFVLLLVQMPLFVMMTMALRNMATTEPLQTAAALHTYLSMTVEGFGWIPNLTVGDRSFILPVAMALFNLSISEVQVMSNTTALTRLAKYRLYILRGLCVAIVPIAAYFPSGVALYWTTSSAYGLVQNLILLSPRVRRTLRIPLTASEKRRPYSELRKRLTDKLRLT